MENNDNAEVFSGATWLGANLPAMRKHEAVLEHLDTQKDSTPRGFNAREFLQFMRGAVNEIKRLAAENRAFRDALNLQNKEVLKANEK